MTRVPHTDDAASGGNFINLAEQVLSDLMSGGLQRMLEPPAWRWVPPGQSYQVGNFTIPDGMVYLGQSLRAVNGYSTEPALINPRSRISAAIVRGPLFDYWPSYAAATPAGRRAYIEWLAGGRKGPLPDERCLMLFFYGLERRLFEKGGTDLPYGEADLLRAEVIRLTKVYSDIGYFQNYAAALLHFLELCQLLLSDAILPAETFLEAARRGRALPPSFDVTLSRLAARKTPLTAEYALAWYLLDPDTSPRVAVTRCPQEMRALFALRFAEQCPKGIKLQALKTRLSLQYFPASRGFGQAVAAPKSKDEPLMRVSLSPLRLIREIGFACAEELGPYARKLGKVESETATADGTANNNPATANNNPATANNNPATANNNPAARRLTTVALLPQPLLETHPTLLAFREWLGSKARNETGEVLRGADLLRVARGDASDNGTVRDAAAELTTNPGKAENVLILNAAERLGFAIEPDVRLGAPALVATEPIFIAPVAASHNDTEKEAILKYAPLAQTLAALVRPERDIHGTGVAAKHTAPPLTAREQSALQSLLSLFVGNAAPPAARARLFLRLRYILTAAEPPKVPRKFAPELTADAPLRAALAELFVRAATLRPDQITQARTTLLSRLFRALEQDEATLYSRLHAAQTDASRSGSGSRKTAGDDTFVTVRAAAPGEVFALPDPNAPLVAKKPARKRTTAATLDAAVIRRKVQETAQVSALLSNIFAGETTATAVATTPPESAAPPRISPVAMLLEAVMGRETITAKEFAALCADNALLPGAAYERINETAFDLADEPALEDDDPITINADVVQTLLAKLRAEP